MLLHSRPTPRKTRSPVVSVHGDSRRGGGGSNRFCSNHILHPVSTTNQSTPSGAVLVTLAIRLNFEHRLFVAVVQSTVNYPPLVLSADKTDFRNSMALDLIACSINHKHLSDTNGGR